MTMEELYVAIGQLTEVQQRQIKAYYFKGLKLRQIAETEGVSHNSISHSVRATPKTEITKQKEKSVNMDRFLSVVRRYTEIEELSAAIIHEFIDRIPIHEPNIPRGGRMQKVEIIYNKVGAVNRFDLKGLRA